MIAARLLHPCDVNSVDIMQKERSSKVVETYKIMSELLTGIGNIEVTDGMVGVCTEGDISQRQSSNGRC